MAIDLSDKYYVKKTSSGQWEDVSQKFLGVRILKLDGMNEQGDAVNVFTQQFVDSQSEDFFVTKKDGLGNDVIVRKNVELQLTFICGTRYGAVDTQTVHDAFVDYITKHGDFYIKSKYVGKESHVVCQKAYKPTTQKLQRGASDSYIIGTMELHTLNAPSASSDVHVGDLYIGFGGTTISNPATLTNVQHYNTQSADGDYSIICPSLSYLWICFSGTIGDVSHAGFEIPMADRISVGNLWCYRSANSIVPHTMSFSIT